MDRMLLPIICKTVNLYLFIFIYTRVKENPRMNFIYLEVSLKLNEKISETKGFIHDLFSNILLLVK